MNSIDKSTKNQAVVLATAAAVVVIILCNTLPLGKEWARFLVDKDEATGAVNLMAAQNFMWLAFFWGLAELWFRNRVASRMEVALSAHYLPENPTDVLTKAHMPQIHTMVVQRGGEGGILVELIRLLVAQFQLAQDTSMANDVLAAEVELRQNEIDLSYNPVRYITWLIPTLGFIGTVWGILQALGTAAAMDPKAPDLLPKVVSSLSVAFWTTLLALLQACILMFVQHCVQGREETLLNKCAQYCLTNFINRLYVER